MVESLGDILRGGFGIWRKNLILGVPFLLDLVIEFLVLMMLISSFIFFSADLFSFQAHEDIYSGFTYPDISGIMNFLFLFFALMMFVYIVCMLINAFFEAGAIGMARTATDTGKTELDEMTGYGKKKVIALFLANILIDLILIAGVVIILGIPIAFAVLLKEMVIFNWLLLLIGVVLSIVYLLVIGVAFSPVKYALVISLWLIVSVIDLVIGVINFFFGLIFIAIPVVGPLIRMVFNLLLAIILAVTLAPITACWWTRLYMDRTGMKPGEISTEIPATPTPATETTTPGPIYV
ncbi:MAG: hypothetical protein B6U86_04860 [Candidatus Altiarchaeales archaeon ex4484_43]|nr:MAG: hypothetical protein B6U86_04860 [Candidatus Altiarchaeales archaeon ex4484_43]